MHFIQPKCQVPRNYMQYKTEHFLRSFVFFTSGMKSAKCSKKNTLPTSAHNMKLDEAAQQHQHKSGSNHAKQLGINTPVGYFLSLVGL